MLALGFPLLPQECLQRLLEVGDIIRTLRYMLPAHIAKPIHRERAALLPPASALCGPIPYALGGPQLVHRPQDGRADSMQGAAESKAPLRVEITLGVDDDVDFPGTAHLRQPALCSLLGGVGDGDTIDFFLFLGDCCECFKRLLGD